MSLASGDGSFQRRVGPKVFADIPSAAELERLRGAIEGQLGVRRPFKDDFNRLDKSVLIASVCAILVSTYHITLDSVPVFDIPLGEQRGVVPGVLFWTIAYLLTAKLVNYFEIAAINRVDVRREELALAQQTGAVEDDLLKARLARIQSAYNAHVSVQLFRICSSQLIVWTVAALGLWVSSAHGVALVNDVAQHLTGSPLFGVSVG